MNYTQSRTIKTNSNSKDYCVELIISINEVLQDSDFKTKISNSSIDFEKTFRSTTNTGLNRKEAFKSLRTGRIDLIVQSNNLIFVKSSIDLSHLTFLSLFTGLCIFLFGWFWSFNLIWIGVFSIVVTIVIFIIGGLNITGKLDEIIEKAKKKT